MTIQQQAEAIVEKYINLLKTSDLQTCYTGDLDNETRVTAIQLAITEVEACIEWARDDNYRIGRGLLTDKEYLQQKIEHLKQM